MTIKLTEESIDEIVVYALKKQITSIKKDLALLKKIKNPGAYKQDDIQYYTKCLEALSFVFKHYTP
jgi:hypothetical protein